jgi:putative transposase
MVAFIDEQRAMYGVEPICEVLQIAPATYYEYRRRRDDPNRRPAREKRDEVLRAEIGRVWQENFAVYGAEKVWRQLRREGPGRGSLHGRAAHACPGPALRGARARLQGDDRGGPCRRAAAGPRAARVLRRAPEPALGGRHHVRGHLGGLRLRGLRRRRVSSSLRSDFALDALKQALHARAPADELVHHSDRGGQYLSIRYTERLA